MRLREKALKGDGRSLDRLLELARVFNSTIDSPPYSDAMMPVEDLAILAAYREDVLAEAESSIAVELDDLKEGPNNDG